MSKANAPYRCPWLYETTPFEIVPGIYYVGNRDVSCHLFDTGKGLLLLDTAYGETTYLLLESIRELGFDPRDIRWIIHTHAHIDHFGATRALVEKYGCRTYLPAVDRPLMESADWTYCEDMGLRYEPPGDYYFEPDVLINPGDVIRFGDIIVTAYSAAGHTPGTMAYVFQLPVGLKVAMHGGVGLNTLTSEYSRSHDLGNTWREAYLDSLARLRGLEVDVVLGNHPSQSDTFGKQERKTPEYNPFIDSGEWARFLDTYRALCEQLIKDDPL